MRLWSIHPKHLDPKGLVALWRESLLAKHVLEGKTRGYKNHPQLIRFALSANPLNVINYYLSIIQNEAAVRGYNFDKTKIGFFDQVLKINVNEGQINYELGHLSSKLQLRAPDFLMLKNSNSIDVHPLFQVIKGPIEAWEIVSENKSRKSRVGLKS